jgi:hypothetical protein
MPGTYIAVRVLEDSEKKIWDFLACHKINVKYPAQERRRHVTLVSSRDDFSALYKPNPYVVYIAFPKEFSFFPTQDGKNGLVLTLDCAELTAKHYRILEEFNATDIYGDYKLHLTFTYDALDLKLENIPKFTAPIILSDEYCEPYRDNWAG